ncbi:PHB depolymerase family esterase [Sphingomonas sp.]|jgi:poly(hydroxyalkanoate) depolymerase family esterase|uniref:extracellular catalytic domain type 1 short-chain-length polyhydroxyalkanoate depolymerase n=1 Tax=Sphingomonas sp. TaxID=28214 RepID=UPI002DE42C72|nr:PHB depolymerase family esterase [Sphingomonas sp.]
MRAKPLPGGLSAPEDRLGNIDDFGSNPGNLRARIYIPNGLEAGAPLVVVLHGCTQTAASYDHGAGWSVLADRYGFALLFPEQRRANNSHLCFNWFLPQHTHRDGGEALSIAQMVRTVRARHHTDPARTYVTGLSAGGAMTSVMLATYPELFAGGAIIAGLPFGAAASMPEAFSAMQGSAIADGAGLAAKVRSASAHDGSWPMVSVWHGTGDRTVSAVNGVACVEQWRQLHALPAQPSESRRTGNAAQRLWRDAAGRVQLEETVIRGMGHGTPVDPSLQGGGKSGAHMLDVGIGSSQEIARFWGIAGPASARPTGEVPAARLPAPIAAASVTPVRPERLIREEREERPPVETGIAKTINDALRAAGLMR